MINKIAQLFEIKRPSIYRALTKIFSENLVKDFSKNIEEKYLIEALARDRGIDESTLLIQIAEIIGIEAISDLTSIKIDSSSLETSAEELYRLGIIPFNVSSPPTIIVSSPLSINIKEFKKSNINIYLALGKDTDKIWQEYFKKRKPINISSSSSRINEKNTDKNIVLEKPKLSYETVSQVIEMIASEACASGASEVSIGNPDSSTYSFKANSMTYQGEIDSRIIESARILLKKSTKIKLKNIDKTILVDFLDSSKGILNISILDLENQSNVNTQTIIKVKSRKEISSIKAPISSVTNHSPNKNNSLPIILVDDDPRFLKILSNIMSKKGWRVKSASSGEEALTFALDPDDPPSLLVSDINMPGVCGEEVLKRIKKELPHLPVIILTGEKDKQLEAKLALLGADAFTRKQDDPSILVSWCQAMINKYQNNSASSLT